jgi:hypothetical protein
MDNLDDIAELVYKSSPQAPNTIQLQLDDLTAEIAESEGVENFVFNILCLITFKGIEILYGHDNVMNLTERQYEKVCQYVQSYGYTLCVYANDSDQTPWQAMQNGIPVQSYRVSFVSNTLREKMK